ncbi:hypothetical protein M271_43575 [Streptomyces rapamycinicus NRRL 5491]|nr:hypothetical protein M271_43575 [Streptomyces rapamycinicus NRRL 5491]
MLTPPTVMTYTGTVPGPEAGGAVTRRCWSETAVGWATESPKCTSPAVLRLTPVSSTMSPPPSGPATGVMPVRVGQGR